MFIFVCTFFVNCLLLNRKLEKYWIFAEGDFYKFFFGNSILPVFLQRGIPAPAPSPSVSDPTVVRQPCSSLLDIYLLL